MKKERKPTLYLIGGMARTGKTIIAHEVIRRRHMVSVSTDGVRAAIRKVLTGESYIAIHQVNFRGRISFHRPGSLKIHHLAIVKDHWDEDETTWQGVLGFIETHDRHKEDLLVEGIAVTPERVHQLKLKHLRVKAVFVGYSHETHIESILACSRRKRDWVSTVIKEHGGDDAVVRKWLREGMIKSDALKRQTRRFGYGYVDVSERPFKTQVRTAVAYLLKR